MPVRITALENGPYQVETGGKFAFGGETKEEKAVYLCRCGGSSNKPFCDGTHRRINFQAPGAQVEVAL